MRLRRLKIQMERLLRGVHGDERFAGVGRRGGRGATAHRVVRARFCFQTRLPARSRNMPTIFECARDGKLRKRPLA